MFEYLIKGGPFMFATLGTSLLCTAVFVFKSLYFFAGQGKVRKSLLPQTLNYIEQNDIPQALRLCSSEASPTGRLLAAALQRASRSEKEIRRAVESVALEEIPKVKGGTVYLPQLSNLATLFGLIGTIHGLITSFAGAGAQSAASRQAALSVGISIAFYNTFFGLAVATASVVFYLILLSKTNQTLTFLEKSAASVVDAILWNRDRNIK